MARQARKRRPVDAARRVAYDALRAVHSQDAYANLVLADLLGRRQISGRDAAFATELLHGTCRAEGSYDTIIAAASGRALSSMQPAVLDVLRLGAHQLLAMRVPVHAAVDASVDLAAQAIGERVTGLVNAVLRKVARHDRAGWNAHLESENPVARLAFEHDHPEWIVDALAQALTATGCDSVDIELAALLAADNEAPTPTLVVRPGLFERQELLEASGGSATQWSPFGVHATGFPGDLHAVREGHAGVQDEGSQLVAWALTQVPAPHGPWLDMCAGPGGKTALLRGLAEIEGAGLVAADPQVHRARLVAQAVRAYSAAGHTVLAADGTQPAWHRGSFARVLVDVPCSGLGALRRRPESRWRRTPQTIDDLVPLQRSLLHSALDSALPADAQPGGVVAYVTCSPHVAETDEIVESVLAQRDDATVLDARQFLPDMPGIARQRVGPQGFSVQLWPHRHHTDAMYLCLLQRC